MSPGFHPQYKIKRKGRGKEGEGREGKVFQTSNRIAEQFLELLITSISTYKVV
jgi:hypothetical protein